MAEIEVESILREIRERVLAQQRERPDHEAGSAPAPAGHAAGEIEMGRPVAPDGFSEASVAEDLSLTNSYLTTTARAWDRLPPLVSNRSGSISRLELWLKRQIKRATHWFTWEQVNFNAATHHVLRDLATMISAYQRELIRQKSDLNAFRADVSVVRADLNRLHAELESLRITLESERLATDADRAQFNARLSALANELGVRDQHLRDEQRVCFKQLSLETSEAAVIADRARHKTEALLEQLQRRIVRLEGSADAEDLG